MVIPNTLSMLIISVQFIFKGIVRNFGHRTSYPSEPVCYLSLEIVFNTFHSLLLVAEIAGARLVAD